ncbi:MAG: uroporphyrinogen decarboxylase, partial [Anaerolineae bacterium]|nr:uroporphyrinogen decarboxylase [Anaerolineae bacterium]
ANLSRYYLDHRVLCEANLAVMHEFELDIVQAISDPYREAADTGLEVEFPLDALPLSTKPLIGEPGDLAKIHFPLENFGPRMIDRLEGISAMRALVGEEVPVMGWVEGALAEACDLRGMNNVMIDLVRRPEWLKELLEKCVEVGIAFACAQIEAGAHMIGLGDAVASQISPRMYCEFALPYEQRIFEAIKAMGGIPRLHICGNTTHLLGEMGHSGAQIFDIDWMVDLHKAVMMLDPALVCGNLDPVAIFLQGSTEQVMQGVRANATAGGARWISAGGCEIPDNTPDVNLIAQHQALLGLVKAPD